MKEFNVGSIVISKGIHYIAKCCVCFSRGYSSSTRSKLWVGLTRSGSGDFSWQDGSAVTDPIPTAFWSGATAPTQHSYAAVDNDGFLQTAEQADYSNGYICELNDLCKILIRLLILTEILTKKCGNF